MKSIHFISISNVNHTFRNILQSCRWFLAYFLRTCGLGPPSSATAMLSLGWPTRQRKVTDIDSGCPGGRETGGTKIRSAILRRFLHFVCNHKIWSWWSDLMFFVWDCTSIVYMKIIKYVEATFLVLSPCFLRKTGAGLDFSWCQAPDRGLPCPDGIFFLHIDEKA